MGGGGRRRRGFLALGFLAADLEEDEDEEGREQAESLLFGLRGGRLVGSPLEALEGLPLRLFRGAVMVVVGAWGVGSTVAPEGAVP